MPYATVEDFRAHADYLSNSINISGDDSVLEELLDRASRDVESYLCFPAVDDPDDPDAVPDRIPPLTASQQRSLMRATVSQAAYRLARDEGDLLEGAPSLLSAAGVSFSAQPPPPIGPETMMWLSGNPSLWTWRTGCAPPDRPTDAPAAA
jgi:hypothetical protein